jgi:hypothetical protein
MSYKDYYTILGLGTNASQQDIKTAYRKLSKKFHPDHNPGDSYFEARFREIQEAYEVLGDDYKRQAYDFNYKYKSFSQMEKDIRERETELEKQRKSFKKWERELKQREGEIDLKTDRKIMIYAVVAIAVLALIIFFATRVSDKEELPAILKGFDSTAYSKPDAKVHINKIKLSDGKVLREYQDEVYLVGEKTSFDKILKGTWTGKSLELDSEESHDIILKADPESDHYQVEYPSRGCSGNWTIREVNDSSIEFKETITGKGECKDASIIRLDEINEKKMLYKSYWPDTSHIRFSGLISK